MNYAPIYKISLVRDGKLPIQQPTIGNPDDMAAIFTAFIGGEDREHLIVAMLDTRLHLIGLNTVSIGTLNATWATSREVYKPAILCNAASVILCHNHPSGDVSASREDLAFAARMKQAGDLLGIPLVDFMIVAHDGAFYSAKVCGTF